MPYPVVQSVGDTNGKIRNEHTVESYKSVWMAHWTRASCNAAEETRGHDASETEDLDSANRDDNLMNGMEVSRCAKGFGFIETKTFEIIDESVKVSSKGMGNERMQSSLFKHDQETDDMQALRPLYGHNLERGKAFDCKSGNPDEISLRDCHFLGEGTSRNPPKWRKTHSNGKDSRFAISNALQEPFVESSCQIVPYGFDAEKHEFDKGKAALDPVTRSAIVSEQLPNDKPRTLEAHEHNQSANLVCERKMDCYLQSNNSVTACLRETNASNRYLSTFSQGLLPKMKKGAGMSKENDILRSVIVTEINRSTSSHHHLSPFLGQGNPLSSSIDSEAKEQASKVTLMDESSTETDTMDIDSFKEKNLHSGENSSESTKSVREVGCRWVNRLKLSSSSSSTNSSDQGTKSSNLDDNSSHEEMSKFFRRMLKSSISSSEPTPRKLHGKESVLSDKSADFLKNDEARKNKGKRLLLSNAWIQRWLHNRSRTNEKKQGTVVVCEPQSSKLENLQNEQFPSIAAMALMGKATASFQPGDLQKRGSFTIWNTRAF